MDKAADLISKTTKELNKSFKDLPKVIKDAMVIAVGTVKTAVGPAGAVARLPQSDPEIKALTRELIQLRKNISRSATYQTGKEGVVKAVDKLIKELSVQKRDITKLAESVRDLAKSVGTKEVPRTGEVAKPAYVSTTDAKLFGKALKDMGVEFEKIKKELADKIVVAIDLETSAAKFGKDAAANFITQIAYQKGTLSELMAGTAKKESYYIKPPAKTKTEYMEKLTTLPSGKQADPRTVKELKRIAVPFEKLTGKGAKDAEEALRSLAEVLKDAEVVLGHNIAGFDLRILQQHFEKAGINVDTAIDKFVDTLELARRNFPERMGKFKEFKGLKPYALEQFEKDLKLAGVEIKSMADRAHDAAYDLEINVKLLKALDKSTEELAAAQSNASIMLKKVLENLATSTQDVAKDIIGVSQKTAASMDIVDAVGTNVKKASKILVKQAVEVENLARVKSALQTRIFKETVIRPKAEAGKQYGIEGPASGEVGDKILRIWGDLAKSLYDLQKNMVHSLETGMRKGLEVWKDASGQAFKLGEGGREWEVKIADVRGLRRELSSTFREQAATGATPGELVKSFKAAFVRREMATPVVKEDMATSIYKEVGSLTKESVAKMGDIVKELYKGIQARTITERDIGGRSDLQDLYKDVALEAKAERAVMENFVKSITIPAAKVTEQGTLAFETKYGAEKALANFATITTGFEKLVKEMESLGAPAIEVARMMKEVSTVPLRPQPGTKREAEAGKLAETLQRRVLQLGGREKLKLGYQRAVSLREMERGAPRKEALKSVTDIGLAELIKKAHELEITALDAARALDEVKFENFYDIANKLFQAGKTPLLEKQAGSIINLGQSERSLRKIGGVINDLMGLMPMIEPGKPKRREYDEQSVKVLTKSFLSELRPEEQKKHIIDVGLLWKDIVTRSEKLGEGLFEGKGYLGTPMASPLDLSDAASSALKQFNLDLGTNLKSLDKTMASMSLANIRALVPFQEFASIQRQQSYATSAISGGFYGKEGREELKTPSLMASRERKLVESGRYGTGGYGLDVLTELRNTASTFEDQIVISGKLAKAFTEITSRLVQPAATYLEQQRITEVTGGVQRMTPRAAKMRAEGEGDFKKILADVAEQFQEILGVPERYRGRADIAEISTDIENIMREHRGRTIEVQTAKLTETFLNYFGRKLSTRFGTKGVSVTPRYGELPKDIGGIEDVAKFIKAGFKTGVATGPGLGVAKVPKSVGQMVSEMFAETLGSLHTPEIAMELHNRLIESGNKFVIEMFKDAEKGLVTEEEATKQSKLFEKVSKIWQDKFGAPLPTGPSGIKEIKGLYKESTGKDPFEMKAIEARISSKGIAKRGLMPEILEGLVNNLIGSTAGTTTLIDKIGKDALTETKAAREKLNEYLAALGFEAFKDLDKVIENLKKPGMTEEAVNKLREFESQWNVYTEVVDEFGKRMQSFVSPKFLQIIEEPHRYKEWSSEEVSKGVKGAKLDFQSFAAMAGVFGEGSSMMKELAASTTLTSKEGWELLRTFQMLDPAMKGLKDTMMKAFPTVKLEDIKGFTDATGTVEDFKETLFDIGKYPTPFKLRIPTAKGEYEEMPMPGAALRTTYREQLLGRGAPTNVARYLANLVDSAKAVEDLTAAASRGGMGLGEDIQRKFADTIRKELTKMLTDAIKEFRKIEKGGALTPQNIEMMESTISKFKSALSAERAAPGVYQEGLGVTELEAVEAYAAKTKGQYKYANILGRISDILIGADPRSLNENMRKTNAAVKAFEESGVMPKEFGRATPERFKRSMAAYTQRDILRGKAKKAFDIELEAGNLDEFAQKVGIDVSESVAQALKQKLEALSRAKVSYFKALGQEVFGKKKGIEQVFFQRVTPAVTGKAISAITDKTKELTALLNTLTGMKYDLALDIKTEEGKDIDDLIKSVRTLNKEHKQYVDKAKKLGLPVLKEGEIAIPEAQAAKIKVRTGKEGEVETNLAELIKKQEKVFVESIRYPFTGTLSVQPHVAKLTEEMGLGLGKHAIAVPGAPQLDLGELNKVIGVLREYVGVAPKEALPEETLSLLEQREKAWAEGTEKGAEKATALTNTIEGLLKVISDATPKFVNLEQKLDFDGDALFVHTGQLEESRKEIGQHFKALGEEVTSVRNLFRSLFTAVSEGEVSTFVEMSEVFKKKHPEEKGFEFLTKPYIREGMKGFNLSKVMESLFTYEKAAADVKGTDKWKQAVSDWSKKFVTDEILPQVFTRLGVTGAEREAYTAKVGGTKAGIPGPVATSSKLEQRISGLADELVRRQLWEKKYSEAITGQLYKLHTGQTVEGISRVARVSEIETGFGKGLAGTGRGAEPSAEFLKAFPKESIALGARPVQEFATRVNEIMRFVIQKGMDVKHAGVEAVGMDIIANIGKTTGAETIMKAMEDSKEQFEELADFNDQITNEVRLRLGAVSTEELKGELKRFEPDIDVTGLNLDRQSIVDRIVKHVDLKAVFEELFRQIKREAVRGLSKSLREKAATMPAGYQKIKLMRDIEAAGGPERLAEQRVSKEAADEGISLFKHITANLQPLYRMRTSMETMGTAAARAGIKVEPTEMALPPGQAGKDLAKQFEITAKAANVLSKAMESAVATPGRGIYTSMVVGALEQRYKELEELQKLDQDAQRYAGKFEYAFTDVMDANKLAAKVWTESKELAGVKAPGLMPADYDVTGWLDQMNAIRKVAAQKLEEISEKAGLPPMVPEEKSLLAAEFEAKFGARTFEALKGTIGKGMIAREEKIVPEDLETQAKDAYDRIRELVKFQASFVEQLRRVSEIAKTVPTQQLYLREAFPDFDPVKEFKPSFEGIAAASAEFVDKEKAVANLLEEYYKQQTTTSLSNIQEIAKTAAIPVTAAAENLTEESLKATDEITEAITQAVVRRKRTTLKYLESKAEGIKPATERPLMDLFRASGVEAGGAYGGGTQHEAIIKSMVGIEDPSMLLEATGLRGQAIHRKIQKEFVQKYPGTEIEQPMEDFENRITGHFDILYEKAGQKILADIKTVYSTAQFDRLKEISNEIGERNITIQQKLDELKASEPTSSIEKNVIRRLENYLSQVNIYLKDTAGAVGEIIVASSFDPDDRVTIPMGKFDPELFNKDIEAVNKARDQVTRILASISATGGLPPNLLKEYPKLYKQLSKRLEQLGPEGFTKAMPTRPVGEVGQPAQEVLGRLTKDQQELFERVSKEYLDIFQGLGGPGTGGAEQYYKLWFASGAGAAGAPPAAPPPPPPTGPGGGGFDDDDFKKRIEEIIAKLQRGIEPEAGEINKLIRTLDEVEERATVAMADNDALLAESLSNLATRIRETIDKFGYGMKSARKLADMYSTLDKIKSGIAAGKPGFGKYRVADIERIQPERPEAVHKNLIALYEAAIRVNRLADSEEIQKFGPEIAKLLMEVAEKGPAGISPQISEAITKLPPEKKGGMRKIWMLYKKSVSEYFLKRLDVLKKEIEEEAGTPEGRKAYMEYEQVLEKYLANIRGTIGRMSDIFTTAGPSGRKTEFVDPELARLTGIYKTPKQIEEIVKQ
jgi:DNA polymerase III epsilon subunit-like protein